MRWGEAMQERAAAPVRVLVIANTAGAATEIVRALNDAGQRARSLSPNSLNLHEQILALCPAALIFRTTPRNADIAVLAGATTEKMPPLILLTPTGSEQSVELAAKTGAIAHLVEPVPAKTLLAAIEVAIARGKDLFMKKCDIQNIRETIYNRNAIERAKAVLMRRLRLTEDQAHRRLQLESRSRNRKVVETAWRVLKADSVLSAGERTAGFSANPPPS